MREIFRAFAASPHWQRGVFIITYDEGGGFFDHVRPPLLPDARASKKDANNFGQAGFRVPTLVASPYAPTGAVEHRVYDHTSILRFLEWRFLGAPGEGRGKHGGWALTARDRAAHNMGAPLRSTLVDADPGFDLGIPVPAVAPDCTPAQAASHAPDLEEDPFDAPELDDLTRFPRASHKPWLTAVT